MSGAGNNLPVVPAFLAGSPTIAQLNQLSYAVQFLVQQDVRPTWTFFNTNSTSAVANSWTTVTPTTNVAFDCDGVMSFASATIVTQGRYALEACISVQIPNAKDEFVVAFNFQAGANNPHFTSGAMLHFGHRGTSTSLSGSAAADNAICLSDVAPMALYPGDILTVQVFLNAALTVDFNQNTSFSQGRFVAKFSGYWLGEAS